jgi:hypothetical protein
LNKDFLDMLVSLLETGARFIVVGAHAMAAHGVPRATGDLDIWIEPAPDNVTRVWNAFKRFGAPVESLGVSKTDLLDPDMVIQIGMPPRRIDILTGITGVEFQDAWETKVFHKVGSEDIPFLGREDLVANKRAMGRAKDIADLEILEGREQGHD